MPVDINGNGTLSGIDLTSSNLGRILQIVRATDTTNRSTTSTSYTDVTGMTVSITPTNSTSAVIIISTFLANTLYTTQLLQRGFFQITDASNNGISGSEDFQFGGYELARISSSSAAQLHPTTIIAYATPATTSSVTYKLRFKSDSSVTTSLYNSLTTGQMFAIEVAA